MKAIAFRCRAAFYINGAWSWLTWTTTTSGGNKHAAILDKAAALGAAAWDYGNADFEEVSRANF